MVRRICYVFGMLFWITQITSCSSFVPIQRYLAQPVECTPIVHDSSDGLLLDNSLMCSSASIPCAFPVTTRSIPNLEYPLFTVERRNIGLDNPVSFWRSGCAGLYQVSSAPAKLVVVYINGYNGRPTGWKPIYNELQALPVTHIFFNYPTGDSLETTAMVLSSLLCSNVRQLRDKCIVLLGHSQGGFIAVRTAQILSQHSFSPAIRQIVTLVTPWNGCKLARYAKLVNPVSPKVFDDIDTDSKFIHTVKSSPLPPETAYTLIYGATAESSKTANPNDELFTTENQLATGKNIKPTSTHNVLTSHAESLRDNEVVMLIKGCVEQCLMNFKTSSYTNQR
ncbi:esterase/lipase family protein [Halodesulfovibrio aestuarii]|uniref:esterase/lipase family protein n=1 Tax=Halodesulfovibrio aestuarii TaxID=126333 RepID=UPI0003F5AAA0